MTGIKGLNRHRDLRYLIYNEMECLSILFNTNIMVYWNLSSLLVEMIPIIRWIAFTLKLLQWEIAFGKLVS